MTELNWSLTHGESVVALFLKDGTLSWSVSYAGQVVTGRSPVRLHRSDGIDLLEQARYAPQDSGSEAVRTITESYELVAGKRTGTHVVNQVERSIRFATIYDGFVTVVLRAAADGVALRLVIEGFHYRKRCCVQLACGDTGMAFEIHVLV